MPDSTRIYDKHTFQGSAAHAVDSGKAVLIGTHRACTPEETFARVQPFLAQMGITRIAEITQLDDLGIPVFQAIRPNSRNISLSQGKGITRALARVSAVMESIEGWHAEQPELPTTRAAIGEMAAHLPYELSDLTLRKQHLVHDALELEWFPASTLHPTEIGQNNTYVPADLVRLDFTVKRQWYPPLFSVQSNGLASGNTLEEALLHALYEIIERDTFERVRRGGLQTSLVDAGTVDGAASTFLLEKLYKAEATFQVFFVQGATGIPCFHAQIASASYPIATSGYGCHLDRDVALSRALSEAAQTRLTMIAGSRDDISSRLYQRLQSETAPLPKTSGSAGQDFREISSSASRYLEEDLQEISRRILKTFHRSPLAVNLTHPLFNIPVVFVVLPQALFFEVLT